MDLDSLIRELEYLREEFGGHVEVRLAHQPSWPFEYGIGQVVAVDLNQPTEEQEAEWDYEDVPITEREPEGMPEPVIYIGEAGQLGYLPGVAKNQLGW